MRSHSAFELKNYFDRVVLINLKRRPDRLARTLETLKISRWPFRTPEIFEAIDGRVVPAAEFWRYGPGAWGCLRSHQLVLEQAILHKVNRLLILEDDVCFVPDFARKVGRFLRVVPENWDGLMLGGQHIHKNGKPIPVSPGVVRCTDCERCHCYAVTGGYMRKLYQRLLGGGTYNGNGINDWIMGRDPDLQLAHRVYAPQFFLAGQDRNRSDLNLAAHPRRLWNPPGPQLTVVNVRGPAALAEALRPQGFYFGSQQARQALSKIFNETRKTPRKRLAQLREWIKILQWEIGADAGLTCAILHPDAVTATIRRASLWPVHEVVAETAAEALRKLPRRLRQRLRPESDSRAPGGGFSRQAVRRSARQSAPTSSNLPRP